MQSRLRFLLALCCVVLVAIAPEVSGSKQSQFPAFDMLKLTQGSTASFYQNTARLLADHFAQTEQLNTRSTPAASSGPSAGSRKECQAAFDQWFNGSYPGGLMMLLSSGFPGSYSDCSAIDTAHYCSVEYVLNTTALTTINITTNASAPAINITNFISQQLLEEWIAALKTMSTGEEEDLPIKVWICAPTACTADDLLVEFHKYLGLILQLFGIDVDTFTAGNRGVCTEDRMRLSDSTGAITMVAILSFLGLAAIVCTSYEIYKEYTQEPPNPDKKLARPPRKNKKERWFTSFGLISNAESLCVEDEPAYLSWFNCFRTCSMCWIMMAHFFLYHLEAAIPSNLFWILKTWFARFTTNLILSADPSMETFFFMGGLLMARSLYKKLKDGSMTAKEWLLHFVHRYMRLTPIYMLILFSLHYLTPIMVRGPYAMWIPEDLDHCGQYWWTNLLYINNFIPYNASAECMGQAWFLAVDMQLFFFIGTPLVVLLWWQPIVGIVTAICVIIASFGANFGLVWAEDLPVCKGNINWILFYDDDHVKPWMRMGAYAIGVLLGIGLIESEKYKEKINKFMNQALRIALFLITGGTMLAIILSTYPLYKDGLYECWTKWNKFQNALYWAATRPVWALCLGTWTYLFWLDRTGVLCRFLSAYIWAIPSRLVYCVYLFHPGFIMVLVFSTVAPYTYNDLDFTQDWTGLILMAFVLGAVWHLFGEKPFGNVESLLTSYIPELDCLKKTKMPSEKSPLINQP
ncbi:CBN-OAC-32 protein [Pelomyxa schiedti]|nr:CBN-OAC-32 protein [Pelomyxa schiedti]